MIRIVGREIVRERSFAFPTDSPSPQVARSLTTWLRRKPPPFEDEAEDQVILRFNLQSRVASIHIRNREVAWNTAAPCQLQLHYCPDGSLHPRLNGQLAGQAAFVSALAAARSSSSEQDAQEFADEHESGAYAGKARGLPLSSLSPADPGPNSAMRNGDSGHQPAAEYAHSPALDQLGEAEEFSRFPTSAEPGSMDVNGQNGGHTGSGYVFLGLLEPGTAQPHVVLSTDAYSLALLGRYRLLADTLASWMGTTITVVSG